MVKLELIGEGRNRLVYRSPSGRTVLKVPKSDAGVSDNNIERIRYRENRLQGGWLPKGVYAPCRFLPGTDALVMEWVDVAAARKDLPSWVGYVDCQQVGINRAGKLLAFDYA